MIYACCCPVCSGATQTASSVQSAYALDASLVRTIFPAAPVATIITSPVSGDSRIDALLIDSNVRLNNTAAPGTPITLTYSFPARLPFVYTGEDALGWRAFTAQQQSAVRSVLNVLEQQIGITFVEVADTRLVGGTMRFSNNVQSGSAGYAYLANGNGSGVDIESDVFISSRYTTNVTQGSYAWTTLVHEIGHALGLKHPGNYGGTDSGANNVLGENEDAYYNTIMSYRDSAQGIQATSFMPYDMLALRYLYGSRAFQTGNNTYAYSDNTGALVSNIVDDAGLDTLDFSAVTTGVNINLLPGAYSSVGKISSGVGALANVTISLDAVIENAIGTAQADAISGNVANNTLTGGRGNDMLDGAGGIDTAVFSATKASYVVEKTASGHTVTHNTGSDGADTLSNIERLFFSDTKLALDTGVGGHAGQTVKLIGVVFGSAAVGNPSYVAEGLRLLDGGMSYENLATAAVGAAGATKSADVVTLLWLNLFSASPTANQVAPYAAMLDNGMSSGALAVLAAEVQANLTHIDWVGLTQTGVVYV